MKISQKYFVLFPVLFLLSSCGAADTPAATSSKTVLPTVVTAATQGNIETSDAHFQIRSVKKIIDDAGYCSLFYISSDGVIALDKLTSEESKDCSPTMESTFKGFIVDTNKGVLIPTGKEKGVFGVEIVNTHDLQIDSPDGRWQVKSIENDEHKKGFGTVTLVNLKTKKERLLLSGSFATGDQNAYKMAQYHMISWSPDSRWILIKNSNVPFAQGEFFPEYGVIDMLSETLEYIPLGRSKERDIGRSAATGYWAPDSRHVAVDDGKSIYNVLTKKNIFTPKTDSLNNRIFWSQKGTYALFKTYFEDHIALDVVDMNGKVQKHVANLSADTIVTAPLWLSDDTFLMKNETSGIYSVESVYGEFSYTFTFPSEIKQIVEIFWKEGNTYYLYNGAHIFEVIISKDAQNSVVDPIVKKSENILPLLAKKDFSSLVPFVHPVKGLMIAAQAHIEMDDEYPVRTISVTDLPRFLANTKKTIWGSRGVTGKPLEMTAKDFWEKVMFRRTVSSSLKYTFDTVQTTDMNDKGMKEQLQKRFPGSHFVDYLLPEISSENVLEYEREASFRLIFEEYQGRWYLVGLMLDQFII